MKVSRARLVVAGADMRQRFAESTSGRQQKMSLIRMLDHTRSC
jgi:hypothetical protein